MKNLTKEQKDLILDFYFRCGSDEQIDLARDLIADNPQAAELYSSLEQSLKQLDSVKYEPCPDNLAELTVARLKKAAAEQAEQYDNDLLLQNELGLLSDSEDYFYQETGTSGSGVDINALLAAERSKTVDDYGSGNETIKPRFNYWRASELLIAAAMLMVVFNMAFPLLSSWRQQQYKDVCAANLGVISGGLMSYQNSNDGRMPYVDMSDDAPWWKVGCQDEENMSNTRHYWLLVKNGYVEAANFVCPGRKGTLEVKLSNAEIQKLCDFPSKKNVSYSFNLATKDSTSRSASQVISVIMADKNPVFENISTKYDQDLFGKIALNERLLKMTSINHDKLGQNVLLNGGSAGFKERRVILNDDIYTLRDTRFYSGNERPASSNDNFLVP